MFLVWLQEAVEKFRWTVLREYLNKEEREKMGENAKVLAEIIFNIVLPPEGLGFFNFRPLNES
jgi:hypothetical protein